MGVICQSLKNTKNFNNLLKYPLFKYGRKKYCTLIENVHYSNDSDPLVNDIINKIYQTDQCIKKLKDVNIPQLIPVSKQTIYDIIYNIYETGYLDETQIFFVFQCFTKRLIDSTSSEELLKHLWSALRLCDIPMKIPHYNCLLKTCVENNYNNLPIDISDITKKNIIPSETTYKWFMKYYCIKGDIRNAIKIFKDFLEENYSLSQDIYYSFILGYLQVNDIESAVETLNEMAEDTYVQWLDKFKALMCIYAKLGDIEKLISILIECKALYVRIDTTDIHDILYILAIKGEYTHYMKIFCLFSPVSGISNISKEIAFISKLIRNKQENLALETLLMNLHRFSQPDQFTMIYHFLNQLVLSNVGSSVIIDICKTFENKHGYRDYLLDAINISFEQDNEKLILELLNEFSKSHVVKPHYFWPIIQRRCKKYDYKGILDILMYMNQECKVVPCFDTLIHYVIPYMIGDIRCTFAILKQCQIENDVIHNAIVWHWLNMGKLKSVHKYIKVFKPVLWSSILQNALKRGLRETQDVKSYISIINHLHFHFTDLKTDNTSTDILTDHLMSLISDESPTDKNLIRKIMRYLMQRNINVPTAVNFAAHDYFQNIV